MQCISCNLNITGDMKAALHSNTCPFCGNTIMDPKKAKNYSMLISVLNKAKFVNKQEVDSKIKEKVIQLLIDSFSFQALDLVEVDPNVVMLDEEEYEESFSPPPQRNTQRTTPSSEANSSARTLTQAKRSAPPRRAQASAGNMYQQAQEDIYSSPEVDEYSSYEEDEELTPEEMKRYFPDSTPLDVRSKVEKSLEALKQAKKYADNGEGIKRLSR